MPARGVGQATLGLLSHCAIAWMLLSVIAAPAAAQTVAAFDFELIDTSLEGEIKGVRPDEQARLARLSEQLRQRLRESGRFTLVDITPVAGEARTMTVPSGSRAALGPC